MNKSFVIRDDSIRKRVLMWLQAIKIDPAKPLEVVIRDVRKPRTLNQNARYWAILQQVGADTGNSVGALHEYCKAEFIGVDRHEVMGRVIEVPKSSAELSTKEFRDYSERVEEWAITTFGVILEAA